MNQECNGSCGESTACQSCEQEQQMSEEMFVDTNELNEIGKVIGVVSGKGGVGKSMTSSMLAVALRRKGYSVGVLDADITGPSIPRMFGIKKLAKQTKHGVMPQKSHNDISIMSINILLQNEKSPVIWRGPIVADVVRQFWTDVLWERLDYLIIDMPPGTGDIPITVFQSIKLNGAIIVTSPQDLVNLVVAKSINMAKLMQVPIIGVVENMSYYQCEGCGKKVELFGNSNIDEIAKEAGIDVLAKMPIDPKLSELSDAGEIEKANVDLLEKAVSVIENL